MRSRLSLAAAAGWPLGLRVTVVLAAGSLLLLASSISFPPGPPSFSDGLVFNLLHLPLYGLLAAALLLLPGRSLRLGAAWLWLPVLVVGAGVLDEWHQAGVDGRSSSLLDVGTDLLAALLVLGLATLEGRPGCRLGRLHLLGLGLALALYWDVLMLLTQPRPLPWLAPRG